MPDIAKSVGYGGRNNKADVLVVQRLLNNFTTGMGINAVAVDGRVDPGGRTIRALNATAPSTAIIPAVPTEA